MFKDLYKNANDKIPTEAAYLRVMKKVESSPNKNKYGYVKIAALAACFILTVSTVSVYEKHSSKKTGSLDIVVSTKYNAPKEIKEPDVILEKESPTPSANAEPQVASEINPFSEAPISTVNPSLKPQAVSSAKPIKKQDIISTTQPVVKPKDAIVVSADVTKTPATKLPVTEKSIEYIPETPNISVETKTNSIVKNQGIPENVGISVARYTITGDVVTSDEYAVYLGKNIEEAVILPDSFKNESSKEHILYLEDDENFNDEWTYYFTDDDSSVFINTTKKTEKIKNIIENADYTKSNISGCEAVVFEEDVQKTALFVDEEIGYSVSSINVSDEIFEDLVTSLVE